MIVRKPFRSDRLVSHCLMCNQPSASAHDEPSDSLAHWKKSARWKVVDAEDLWIVRLIIWARERKHIKVVYRGGENPGETRELELRDVFKRPGYPHVYVEAWCRKRKEERTFRADKLALKTQPNPVPIYTSPA